MYAHPFYYYIKVLTWNAIKIYFARCIQAFPEYQPLQSMQKVANGIDQSFKDYNMNFGFNPKIIQLIAEL